MLHLLKKRIVNGWIADCIISEEDRELYEYGVEITVEYIINIITTILIAILTKEIIACAFMYISFMFLRSYSGGIHAKSFLRCYIYSSLVIFISLILIKLNLINIWIYRFCGMAGALYLWFTKPVASKNKEVSEKEKKFFCKKEKNIITYIIIISIVAFFIGFVKIEKGLESTLIIAFVSNILTIIKR